MAFNNILTGFDKYSRDFNGFRELIIRSDAASILIQKYKEENPLAIDKDWSSNEIFGYTIRISMMELFLCNKQMLSKLDHIERKDLMNEYRLKKSQKNNRIELYQHYGFQTIYLAIVKLLESENVDLIQNINMDIVMPYITTGILLSKDVFKEINNAVNNYLLNDLRPISEESADYEVYSIVRAAGAYTPKGKSVYTSQHNEITDHMRDSLDNHFTGAYPGARKLPTYGTYSSTNLFNCHGYAWHVSERGVDNTNEYRWIGDEEVYWTDYNEASYIEVVGNPVYPAKVHYQGANHSAVLADPSNPLYFSIPFFTNEWVISKWDWGPLMCHAPDDCPYAATNLKYYKLNPKIVDGNTDDLCHYDDRTFTTDITHMPEGTLEWTYGDYITNVSQTNTDPTYTVVNSSALIGETWVKLEINTLSDFTWSETIYFNATRTPEIANQKVDGYYYYSGMEICPGVHDLSFTPVGGNTTTTWTVPPGISYNAYGNTLVFMFPYYASSVTITALSENTCGEDNCSFYLTKQIWGCDWSYGMTLYPNPASDNVTITMIENQPLVEYSDSSITRVAITDAKADGPTTYTIRIYNNQGTLLSNWTRSGKDFNIPLINMRDGTYIIEVSDGENSYRQQLFVKHK